MIFKDIMKKWISLSVLLLFGSIMLQAQTDDNIAWLNSSIKIPLSEKSSFSFKPIFRYEDDFSSFQNSSIDYSLSRKLTKGFSISLIGRTWFLPPPGERIRQFIWTDINHNYKRGNGSLLNKVRWHNALDVNDIADADFIRYLIKYSYAIAPKVKINIGAEPWLRLNDINQLQRARYHGGISYALSSNLSLGLNYWREDNWNGLAGDRNFNVFLPGLVYTGQVWPAGR